MKRSLRHLAISCAFAMSSAHGAEPRAVTVVGRVAGESRKHTVHVAIWNADGFLKVPHTETRIAPGSELRFQFVVDPGRWAVSAYEDINDNGVLDMGLFGPREPSGFWRPFRGWHKPRFDEVASTIDVDVFSADVVLK